MSTFRPPPAGIKELQATHDGFTIDFTAPVNRPAATKPQNYTIFGYTRVWQGSYATPDSGRYKVNVSTARLSQDGRTVRLTVDKLREKYVYEVNCGRVGADPQKPLWPATGHYTMTRIPGAD